MSLNPSRQQIHRYPAIREDSYVTSKFIELDGTVERSEALVNLDRLSINDEVLERDVCDIVGVIAGVKPSALVYPDERLVDTVNKLGLLCYQIDDENMSVAYNPHNVYELADCLENAEYDDPEYYRKMGGLLGYPETATEYFIERTMSLRSPAVTDWLPIVKPKALEGTMHDDLYHFMLSPSHWREEIEQYIAPLDSAMRDAIPNTCQRLKRKARNRIIADKALSLLGMKRVDEFDNLPTLVVE